MTEWDLLHEKEVFKGFRRVVRETWRLPNGREHDFEIIRGASFALSLALTEDGQVIVTQQFRPGPREILYDLPGGLIDPDENPIEAATRELLEETGYEAGEAFYLGSTQSGAYASAMRHALLLTGCHKVGEAQPEGSESIEVVLMSLEDLTPIMCEGHTTCQLEYFKGLLALGRADLLSSFFNKVA